MFSYINGDIRFVIKGELKPYCRFKGGHFIINSGFSKNE